MEKVTYPADTSAQANDVPTNLHEVWADVSHTDSTAQTHDGTTSEVNYDVTRTWNNTEGVYNPTNTSRYLLSVERGRSKRGL